MAVIKCPGCGKVFALEFPLHDCRPPAEQKGVPKWFRDIVPPRGSLASSQLAQVIKDLRRRKIEPFYYEARKQEQEL